MDKKYYETVTKMSWIYLLWQWADKNKITDEDILYDEELGKDIYRGIPRNKEKLKNIELLDLSGFNLTEVPEEIGYLTNLKMLSLSNNNLEKLPDSIINCENLEFLDVSVNRLTNISKDLCLLKKLYRINVNDNQIKNFPKCLEEKRFSSVF